jgi:hypothetical protein
LLRILSVLCFFFNFVYFTSLLCRLPFSICVQVYWPLQPGGNPTAVNKYHIIYITQGSRGNFLIFLYLDIRTSLSYFSVSTVVCEDRMRINMNKSPNTPSKSLPISGCVEACLVMLKA